jgi:hypothetical protein
MRKRHVIIISALVTLSLAIVSVCVLTLRGPKEPSYQGRTVTDWLGDIRPGPTEMPAAKAIIAIGTNGIPTMFKLLRAKSNTSRDQGCFGLLILGCNDPAASPLILPQLHADMQSQDKDLFERAKLVLQGIQSKSNVYPH